MPGGPTGRPNWPNRPPEQQALLPPCCTTKGSEHTLMYKRRKTICVHSTLHLADILLLPLLPLSCTCPAIGWPLTWLFETAWLLVFPRETTATFYLSAILLFCGLGAIGWTAGRTHALSAAPAAGSRPNQFVWALFVLPTSMNAAWMSVASCLGLDVLAVSQGLPSDNEVALAATLAVIVACVGAAVILAYRDVAWGLVLIWAFVAVLKAHPHLQIIRTLAVIAIGVSGLCAGYVAVRHWQEQHSGWVQAGGEGAGGASMQQPLLAEEQPGAPAGPSAAPPVQLEG